VDRLYITDSQGKNRTAEYVTCDYCSSEFLKQKRLIKDKNYCNRKCAGFAQSIRHDVECAHCKEKFTINNSRYNKSKSKLFFCCVEHKNIGATYIEEIRPEHYGTSEYNYRDVAFREYPKICCTCGNKNEKVLEVHHIDKDRVNNNIDNLIVLCANCHTLLHKEELWIGSSVGRAVV
jgi:hypothetical protein